MLKVGRAVILNDRGATVSLSFFDDEVPLSHTVVEVGEDYIVLRDIAGVKETIVPVFAVKAIEKVRVGLE
jgi:predicted membrane protein